VLILTGDAEFVGELIEPLEAWRADPRWIGAGDAALAYLEAFDPGGRHPVLIVDGRYDVLQALGWAHAAAALPAPQPPYVLFIADEARIDSLIGLADGELDSILPAPFTLSALRSAFHALMVEPADWFLANAPAMPAPPPAPRRPSPVEVSRPEAPIEPPAPRAQPERTELPRRAAAPARPRRILIAASNPANRKIMGTILARTGYAVHLAETVDEAHGVLDARDIDVLLLDLADAAGADRAAARAFRRARPGLVIVALTGESAAEAEDRAREDGLNAVLPKPVEPKRLAAAIAAVLDGDEPAAPPASPAIVAELATHPRFVGERSSAVGDPRRGDAGFIQPER
jgi:DNA-binding response OmpR family regulator